MNDFFIEPNELKEWELKWVENELKSVNPEWLVSLRGNYNEDDEMMLTNVSVIPEEMYSDSSVWSYVKVEEVKEEVKKLLQI